jgi:hypothetical protein
MAVTEDWSQYQPPRKPGGGSPFDAPGYPSVKDIPVSAPVRRVVAPTVPNPSIAKAGSSSGPQNRRVNGSHEAQKVIDAMPGLDQIKALPGFDQLSPAERQHVVDTYHETVTKNSTWYKSLAPDARDAADAHLKNVEVADLRQSRGETPKPNYAATPREQFMSGLSNSPIGMGYSLATGEEMAPNYQPNDGADTAMQVSGGIAGSLPLMALGGGLGGAAGVGLGAEAGSVTAGLAEGLGAGVATQIPQQGGAMRLGRQDLSGALKEGLPQVLAAGLAGTANPIAGGVGQSVARNALQTAAGELGTVASGGETSPGSFGQNMAIGLGLDLMHGARQVGRRPGPPPIEAEMSTPHQPEPLALPPARGSNQGSRPLLPAGDPMVEAFQTGAADRHDLPELSQRGPLGNVIKPDATAEGLPRDIGGSQRPMLAERNAGSPDTYAPPPPKEPVTNARLAAERDARIQQLQSEVGRLQAAYKNRKGKSRDVIADQIRQRQEEATYLQQQALTERAAAEEAQKTAAQRASERLAKIKADEVGTVSKGR